MELHNQALKYLQQYTRRCLACGGGRFAKLLGKLSTQEDRKKRLTDIDEILQVVQFEKEASTGKAENGRRSDMTLTAILEFVEICIKGYNIPQARRLLTDCEAILQEMFKSSEDELVILPYLTGKVQTLEGKCYLESGLISEAETILEQALDNLGHKFPRREIFIDVKTVVQLEQLRLKLVCFQNWKSETAKEDTVNYTEQLADCLAQMFELFRTKGMKKHARLAAIWSLNEALNSSENFFILCTCFTNMLITAHIYQNRTIIPHLENEGINICSGETDTLEIDELKTIAELYAGIFFSRWVRGQIKKATKIGFVCVRMASTLGSIFLKLLTLPRLIHLLMISCRHSEMVTQLRELEFVSHNDLDKSGRTWYYALCADVQLDTGLMVLSFVNCEQYFLREGDTMISLRDPEAEKRYFTSMWLWCIRTEQWEASKLWSNISLSSEPVMDEHTVAATITEQKKLEGLLILYVHKVNTRDVNAIITMAEIKNTFKTVDKMIKTVKIAIPRYMLLRAYYHIIKSQKSAARKLLRRTKTLCLKVGNRMIYTWAVHCEMAWSGAISSVQEDMWKDLSNNKIRIEWDEVNANDAKMVPFTFPLPKYIY